MHRMDRAKWIGSLVVAWLLAGPGVAMAQSAEAPPLSAGARDLHDERAAGAARRGVRRVDAGDERLDAHADALRPPAPPGRREAVAQGVRPPGLRHLGDGACPGAPASSTTSASTGLQVPASYRAIVRFRWYRPDGTVARHVAQAHRRRAASPTCVPISWPAACARCSTRGRRSRSTRSSCATTGARPRGSVRRSGRRRAHGGRGARRRRADRGRRPRPGVPARDRSSARSSTPTGASTRPTSATR